jgi:non-heme chloroperoxidase
MRHSKLSRLRDCFILSLASAVLASGADKKSWKDMYVQIGDIKVHYLEAGAGDRNLVFIPGWTMTAEIWREQIPYFASRGFRVVALDPRSQGLTTKTEGGNTYQQHAADLHAFLKTLNMQHADLVGWSAGVVALLEYVSSSEAIQPDHLVLVDGFPAFLKQPDYPAGFTMQQGRDLVMKIQEDRPKFTNQFARSMFKSKQPELLYKEIMDGSLRTPIGTAMALFFDLFSGDRRPALLRVTTPTLIVVTPENRALGEFMQSKIAKSKLEIIPEAGHALFLEKPQTFNQTLEAFLGEN